MKKLVSVILFMFLISAPSMAFDPYGIIYQNTTHPLVGASSSTTYKMGKAKCKTFFGIVAVGDCSIKTAMKNGKIKNLAHADQHIKCILGCKTIETIVYGQ